MNIRYILSLFSLLLLLATTTGCESLVRDKGDCPVVISFTPYVNTPCNLEKRYPQGADLLELFVCNDNGDVISYRRYENAILAPDAKFEVSLPFTTEGHYTCYVWAGAVAEDYDIQPAGETLPPAANTKLSLKMALNNRLEGKIPHTLYQGKFEVAVPKNESLASSIFLHADVALRQYTHDFFVSVQDLIVPDEFHIEIRDENASYSLNGELASLRVPVVYASPLVKQTDKLRKTHLRTLDIAHHGTNPKLVLIRNHATKGQLELLVLDLKKDLLEKLPEFNPLCDFVHHIDIKVLVDDLTGFSVEIWVEGWKVHTYDVILDL